MCGERFEHAPGDVFEVFRRAEPLGDRLEGDEEVLEVAIDVHGAGGFERQWFGVVALRELHQGLGRDGAFKVQMELGLGQPLKPGGDLFRCVGFVVLGGRARHPFRIRRLRGGAGR